MTTVGIAAPDGLRWANGGGSNVGECNGWHLAPVETSGTICGRYGPHTIEVLPKRGTKICGNCARIARLPRVLA